MISSSIILSIKNFFTEQVVAMILVCLIPAHSTFAVSTNTAIKYSKGSANKEEWNQNNLQDHIDAEIKAWPTKDHFPTMTI